MKMDAVWPLSLAGLGFGASVFLLRAHLTAKCKSRDIEEKIQMRHKERETEFKTLRRELLQCDTSQHKRIVALDSSSLLDAVKKGKISRHDVLQAYQAAALECTDELNCIVEFIGESNEWVESGDSGLNRPLFGLPVSVKENFDIPGHDSTLGFGKFLYSPRDTMSPIIETLIHLGAIPFCKTNIPQSLISYGDSNPIYGEVRNPHARLHSPGGSSSGEGALLGAGASMVGLGSDTGGSGRVPAHFSGCFSLKPTSGRLSGLHQANPLPGMVGVFSCPTVMSRELNALVLVVKELFNASLLKKLDPFLPPLPFNDAVSLDVYVHDELRSERKLKIGYYTSLEVFPSTRCCQKAVMKSVEALTEAGHILIPFVPLNASELFELELPFFHGDEGHSIVHLLKGEAVDESLQDFYHYARLPRVFQSLLKFLHGLWDKKKASLIPGTCVYGSELWEAERKRSVYLDETIRAWKEADLDACIGPVWPTPAVKLPFSKAFFGSFSFAPTRAAAAYTMMYNMLDFPAGVVPVTRVTEADMEKLQDFPDKIMREAVEGGVGLPIGVQVVTLPWQEEKLLRVMKDLHKFSTYTVELKDVGIVRKMKEVERNVALAISLAAGLGTSVTLYRYFFHSRSKEIRKKIKQRQETRREQFEGLEKKLKHEGQGLMTEERQRIVSLNIQSLLDGIQEGKISSMDVLHAYQAAALECTQKLNCVTEFIQEAEGRALAQDMSKDDPKGPLHGLPISVKENFALKGYDATMGYGKLLGQPRDHTAVVVETLMSLGAIPFCRTNTPQTLITYDHSNPIYGATKNPHNPSRGPGGSSSGEGALIGGGASIVGLGNDLGGSGRIPAHFCGCFSLKPTVGRISGLHEVSPLPGLAGMKSTPAIMTRDLEALTLVTRELFNASYMKELDPCLPPLNFNDDEYKGNGSLTIGYYMELSTVSVTPSCRRAVLEAKAALEKAGHKLIPFEPPDADVSMKLSFKLVGGDEGKNLLTMLKDEPVDPCVAKNYWVMSKPQWVRKILWLFLKLVAHRDADHLPMHSVRGYDLWAANAEKAAYIQKVIYKWREVGIDAVIGPGFPTPALKQGYPSKLLQALSYTMMYNVLDFPAAMFPITTVSKEDMEKLKQHPDKLAQQAVEGGEGLPVAVQIAALPWQEERVLRVMKDLGEQLKTK
ncbi:unnamed protein product [Darwinula stevensoni]|uniref:fatty acid amide hydrolase n=1 Tax=Darwinula stevensoni TaxID=69355 RepID=A0A7R8XHU7_9CRUS|nr:unnamed protein product [Darwinula stevensoni]CAG0893201.1 unnamed protein product [Darwinula stevensoni]